MNISLEQFKQGITKHANVLRRHGILDPIEQVMPKRKYKKQDKDEADEMVDPDLLDDALGVQPQDPEQK